MQTDSAAPFVPATRSLATLAQAAGSCEGCELYRDATQTVFGAGPKQARFVLVGEQPGDMEDRQGKPFVGPAGRVLDRALADAGIVREEVYVTNAVKHFRFVRAERGKRRLHEQPDTRHVLACRPWLAAELTVIAPDVVVALGATAAQYLLLLGPFQALNPALEEASLVCGASRFRSFLQIEIPALAPAILGCMILGFVLGMGMLTTPLLLGEPAGIYVLPTEIYRLIQGVTPADYAGASTLSLLLVLVVLVLVAIQSKVLGQRKFVTVTGKSSRRERVDIGAWKWLGTVAIILFTVFALVLPVGQFVLGSFESYFGVYSHFTTGNYSTVFQQPGTSQAFTTTILVAVVSGFLATLLGVLITLVTQRSTSRLRRLPDICVWLLWAVPGITLSLGIIWAYLSVPGLKQLYGTQWIVLLALVVGTTPIASRAVGGSIAGIGRELEEAARTSGASALRSTAGILVRLIAPSFLVSWLISGIVASGNLDIPILLASPTNQTVPLLAYDLYDNGSLSQAAATFCVFIGIIAALLVVVAVVRLVLSFRVRLAQRAALVPVA